MYNLVDLTGKKILITGASSGMGRATAILCSKLGAEVILVARREEKLQSVLAELVGDNHKYYPFDLSQVDYIEEFIKKIIADNGALDGFVHSAGVTSTRPFKSVKPEVLKAVMDINFFAFVEIVRCITKKNCFNPGLSIVGISSIASKFGNSGKTAYCASKAAMDLSVKCIAKELADKKIRVNTVNPGWINTDMYQKFLDKGGDTRIVQHQYMGVGEPDDVANMITYLLSDAAKFISGSNVLLDGGRLSF